jgi:hypothetical protein
MKTTSKTSARILAVIGLIGLVATAAFAAPTLIDVAFTSLTTPKVGFAATGASANDFWNSYSLVVGGVVRGSGELTNLRFVDGATSGVGLAVANATGGQGDSAPDPMYQSYLYARNGSIILTVTHLSAGSHDFYLYGHGDQDNQNSVFELVVGGASLGDRATTNGAGWKSPVWQEGVQFVKFPNVDVADGQAVNIQVKPGAGGVAALSGLQISSRQNSVFASLGNPMPGLNGLLFWGMLAAVLVVLLTLLSRLLPKTPPPSRGPVP